MTQTPLNEHDAVDRGRRFISFIAFVLILLGQVYLIPTRDASAVPVMLALTAPGLVLFTWGQLKSRPAVFQWIGRRLSIQPAGAWIAASVVMAVIATGAMLIFEQRDYTNYAPVVTLWFGSAACYFVSFAPTMALPVDWKAWLKAHWPELAGLALVTLAAFVLRFYKLGDLPRILNGDEGWLGNTAISTDKHPYANPFSLWENFGALYLQTVNVLFAWFGENAFSLRLLPAISGTLAIPAVYLFGRQIGGRRIGFIAAILLAFSHTHIHFSRTAAVAYIHGTWLVPLELYFLLSGLKTKNTWRAALGGVLLGFHYSIYLTSQIITGLILVYALLGIFVYRAQLKDYFRQMAAFWAGLVILLIPHLVYSSGHPNEFFSRLSVDGSIQSGWLANTMAATGQSAVQILSGRVLHAFLALIYYPAFDFYGSRVPMLTLFTAAMFLLGLGICLWRTLRPGVLLLNGYFWASTLAVGIFAIPPSADSYRMLIALPAALVMTAIGLDSMITALGMGWEKTQRVYVTSLSVVLLTVIVFNVWVYFFDFVGQCRFGNDNPQTRYYSYLGSYLETAPRALPVFLLSDNDFPYDGNPTVEFLSSNRKITSTIDGIDSLALVSGDMVIANPNRIAELYDWTRTHPGGEPDLVMDCNNQILFVYKLP